MEAFHLLSRGGAKFDKKRFSKDVQLFSTKSLESPESTQRGPKILDGLQPGDLPAELDFFKYAKKTDSFKDEKGKGKEKETEQSQIQKEFPAEEQDASADDSKKRKRGPLEDETTSKAVTKDRIATTGSRVPEPISEFSELSERYSVPEQLLENLTEYGYEIPTGIQSQGIPILLEPRDLAAISPTGTGKTLAYLLPIFTKLDIPSSSKTANPEVVGTGVRALILAPTRELAGQIHNEALKLAQGRKWRMVLFGKTSGAALSQKEVRDKTDIVISTPMRLVAALKEGLFELDNVRHLIFDEADRLLEDTFLHQVEEIMRACTHPSLRKAVFSATLPAGVERIAKSFLFDPIRVVVGLRDSAALTIKQSLVYVGSESGKLSSLRQLLANSPPLPLLVFVQSRERAAELHQELIFDGISVDVLHADMAPKQREESVRRMWEGKTWVMISTEVMARGMDFGGLRGVLNYDFPQTVQSYIHRIGRTGRAGREGDAITYFTNDDAPYLKSIANVVSASGWPIPKWITDLPKPSRLKKKLLRRAPVERKSVSTVSGRNVVRREAVKKREMIKGSKRRKLKAQINANPSDEETERKDEDD